MKLRPVRWTLLLAALLLVLAACGDMAGPEEPGTENPPDTEGPNPITADITVTSTADSGEGSLRAAVAAAAAGNIIGFDDTVSGQTIALASNIPLTKELTISGDVTLDGGGATNIFSVSEGAVVTLQDMTLTNGSALNIPFGLGGAIFNDGNLTLEAVTVSNSVANIGGGIFTDVDATTTLKGTTSVTENEALRNEDSGAGLGGGVYVTNNASLSIEELATITNNYAECCGGGVFISGGNIGLDNAGSISGNTAANVSGNTALGPDGEGPNDVVTGDPVPAPEEDGD